MSRQTGISFDIELMDNVRTIKGQLQQKVKGRTVNNTDLIAYLLFSHEMLEKMMGPGKTADEWVAYEERDAS